MKMKRQSWHRADVKTLPGASQARAADGRRIGSEVPRDSGGTRGSERILRRDDQDPRHPSGEVRRWFDRLRQQVRPRWKGRRGGEEIASGGGVGRGRRRDEGVFFGLRWQWEWLEEPTERDTQTFSSITLPLACCPNCRRVLAIAPTQSRVVRRPVWPAIFTCPCGFFRGFRQPPEEIEAAVYREIDREARSTLGPGPLGEEADFELSAQ